MENDGERSGAEKRNVKKRPEQGHKKHKTHQKGKATSKATIYIYDSQDCPDPGRSVRISVVRGQSSDDDSDGDISYTWHDDFQKCTAQLAAITFRVCKCRSNIQFCTENDGRTAHQGRHTLHSAI